ncbi:unnamed protein product [Protopolystoma xenopodis]|uniref:Uncharacterized protein n=1 Tax=Protopolystoma xenopodis TaxID=117903 RepID=A0A3S5C0J6_9PLAT|nr:unnamed protein product [Protopolystoma xenopodis]
MLFDCHRVAKTLPGANLPQSPSSIAGIGAGSEQGASSFSSHLTLGAGVGVGSGGIANTALITPPDPGSNETPPPQGPLTGSGDGMSDPHSGYPINKYAESTYSPSSHTAGGDVNTTNEARLATGIRPSPSILRDPASEVYLAYPAGASQLAWTWVPGSSTGRLLMPLGPGGKPVRPERDRYTRQRQLSPGSSSVDGMNNRWRPMHRHHPAYWSAFKQQERLRIDRQIAAFTTDDADMMTMNAARHGTGSFTPAAETRRKVVTPKMQGFRSRSTYPGQGREYETNLGNK